MKSLQQAEPPLEWLQVTLFVFGTHALCLSIHQFDDGLTYIERPISCMTVWKEGFPWKYLETLPQMYLSPCSSSRKL